MKPAIPIIVVLSWFHTPLLAQIKESASLEILIDREENPFFLVHNIDQGLVLYRNINLQSSYSERTWEILLLDTAFHMAWSTRISTGYNQRILGGYIEGVYCYFLLGDYAKPSPEYQIIRLDLAKKQLQYFPLGEYIPEKLLFLRIHQGIVIIGGVENNKPSVVCYPYGDNRPVVLQGIYGKNINLLDIQLLEKEGFLVYVGIRDENRERSVRINAYRRKGDLRSNIVLKPGPGRNLLDCKVIGEIREDQPLNIAGTYSVSKGTVANGIFTLLIHPDGKQEFKYYSFGNLKHFFSYLPPSVEEKEVERIESKRAKGKRNSYGVNVSVREPLITRDNNIFVGECYSRSSRVYNSYYGWQTGYMYSHAFFVGVNKEGKVIWDNAMPIDRFYESSELQQVILTEFGEQFLSFTYSKNHLLYKVFDDSGKSVQESDFPLTTNVEVNLSALREDLSEYVIRKWYDNHVLIYGVNYFDAGFETVRVFFLKKISVEEDKSADQR